MTEKMKEVRWGGYSGHPEAERTQYWKSPFPPRLGTQLVSCPQKGDWGGKGQNAQLRRLSSILTVQWVGQKELGGNREEALSSPTSPSWNPELCLWPDSGWNPKKVLRTF